MQHSAHFLMIRPVQFDFNAQTAVNNSFQVQANDSAVQEKAAAEFDRFIQTLSEQGIDITVVDDTPDPHTPDSIFPNNWISFHQDGAICLYPMFADNRRKERKAHVLATLARKFDIRQTIDLTGYEANEIFLEGTGSMVLDRENRIAYACLSPRTNQGVFEDWCHRFDYAPVSFIASDEQGMAIYHTNVMMCIADRYAVICMESIIAPPERRLVTETLQRSGKKIIDISFTQMNHFAGNMLQVHNLSGQTFLVMSSQAFNSLDKEQVKQLESFNPILHADIGTIETHGGGSTRCMMAEIFLPIKK